MCLTSIELYLENSTFVLLYKLHIDYSKIYPGLICEVLSLEKLYKNFAEMWGVYSRLWDTLCVCMYSIYIYISRMCVYYLFIYLI